MNAFEQFIRLIQANFITILVIIVIFVIISNYLFESLKEFLNDYYKHKEELKKIEKQEEMK